MKPDPNQVPTTELDLLESRLAATVAAALRAPTEQPGPGVEERLRFAREQAIARARAARAAPAAAASPLSTGGGTAVLGRRGGRWWPRLGALLPVAVLAIGAFVLVDVHRREQLQVASEIDAALLADDLPPTAYADPGFVAFLKLQQP